jgi:CheY-like chemotaxis protein
MGGELKVTSQPDQGTCFSFDIPISSAIAPSSKTAIEGNIIGLAPNQPQYRCLIVDDSSINRMLLTHHLEPLGFEIREVENGQEAVALWETWQPHLIWMDMLMPVMNGYEATRRIRAVEQKNNLPPTVILALTATAFEESQRDILTVGCDDILTKPFQGDRLFALMKQYLKLEYCYG